MKHFSQVMLVMAAFITVSLIVGCSGDRAQEIVPPAGFYMTKDNELINPLSYNSAGYHLVRFTLVREVQLDDIVGTKQPWSFYSGIWYQSEYRKRPLENIDKERDVRKLMRIQSAWTPTVDISFEDAAEATSTLTKPEVLDNLRLRINHAWKLYSNTVARGDSASEFGIFLHFNFDPWDLWPVKGRTGLLYELPEVVRSTELKLIIAPLVRKWQADYGYPYSHQTRGNGIVNIQIWNRFVPMTELPAWYANLDNSQRLLPNSKYILAHYYSAVNNEVPALTVYPSKPK